jgi:phenylalanyl-tRNA synthetase alpha chain
MKEDEILTRLFATQTKHEALQLKAEFTSNSQNLFKQMKALSQEEKRLEGEKLNIIKTRFEEAFKQKIEEIRRNEVETILKNESVDITCSSFSSKFGGVNPITHVTKELIEIMEKYGFSFVKGPEIETNYYNFDALNIPKNHPAREMHDTFYLDFLNPEGENFLLRTHTSNTQIRGMKQGKPPFALVSAGRTYRSDFDKTHTPMFNQLECLFIEKNAQMSNLLWLIDRLFSEFFTGMEVKVRLRPSFFPFTEPSAEVDIDIGNGFLEVMGAGMVHPNVLKECDINPEEYSGFAFGLGIERLAMLKYGIIDLRDFFNSNKKWNESYRFRL